jgi:hypothetical protein
MKFWIEVYDHGVRELWEVVRLSDGTSFPISGPHPVPRRTP